MMDSVCTLVMEIGIFGIVCWGIDCNCAGCYGTVMVDCEVGVDAVSCNFGEHHMILVDQFCCLFLFHLVFVEMFVDYFGILFVDAVHFGMMRMT